MEWESWWTTGPSGLDQVICRTRALWGARMPWGRPPGKGRIGVSEGLWGPCGWGMEAICPKYGPEAPLWEAKWVCIRAEPLPYIAPAQ